MQSGKSHTHSDAIRSLSLIHVFQTNSYATVQPQVSDVTNAEKQICIDCVDTQQRH